MPRTKDIESLINKALYRKNYALPYEKVTDKVGLRIIVLTEEDIETVESIVKTLPNIALQKARDFRDDRRNKPDMFGYQGLHYEMKPIASFRVKEHTIPIDYVCELQIRTLLQHSVSELSHDLTYKSFVVPSEEVQRLVSRCIGGAESLSFLFSHASGVVKAQLNQFDAITRALVDEYGKLYRAPISLDLDFQRRIFDAIRPLISSLSTEELIGTISCFANDEEDILRTTIKSHYDDYYLFKQPIVLLLLLLAHEQGLALIRNWPYLRDELAPLFQSLGEAMPETV